MEYHLSTMVRISDNILTQWSKKWKQKHWHDLSKSISLNYVLPDLLNQRHYAARSKIKCSITEKTNHIYYGLKDDRLTIKSMIKYPDFEKISQALIEMTKPNIVNFIEKYEKLKILSKEEVSLKILLMLKKYISCPIWFYPLTIKSIIFLHILGKSIGYVRVFVGAKLFLQYWICGYSFCKNSSLIIYLWLLVFGLRLCFLMPF